MNVDTPASIVEHGYDRIAEQYLASNDRKDPILLSALEELALLIPASAAVLDLGCGAGVPVTQWLAERYEVTGVDISAQQSELASALLPTVTVIKADMMTLDFPPDTFDAIVSFYAIIHVLRQKQPQLLRNILCWLKPGGAFLATWAMTEWEGQEANWEGWGAPMWWSHYDAATNLNLMRAAGFEINSEQVRTTQNETWLWVLAQKPAAS